MALSLDPATKIITIPQADLTLVTGTLYELDTNQFRKDVMTLCASEDYIWMPNPYLHNTEVAVAGTTFARTVEFINGYQIEFEDGNYSVRLEGSNNNIFDVENGILIQNSVQVIAQNSAGLVNNNASLASRVMASVVEAEGSITLQQALSVILSAVSGESAGDTFYTPNGNAVRITGTTDASGNRSSITITPSS